MEHDIKLTFGKHKGKTFSQVPLDYVLWLAENAREQQVKDAARSYLVESGNGDSFSPSPNHTGKYASAYYRTWYAESEILERKRDEQFEEEEYREILEERERQTLRWTAQSGSQIAIYYGLLPNTIEHGFEVKVDGRTSYHTEDEIVAVENVPGIVARIGRVGLTAERRDALLALAKE